MSGRLCRLEEEHMLCPTSQTELDMLCSPDLTCTSLMNSMQHTNAAEAIRNLWKGELSCNSFFHCRANSSSSRRGRTERPMESATCGSGWRLVSRSPRGPCWSTTWSPTHWCAIQSLLVMILLVLDMLTIGCSMAHAEYPCGVVGAGAPIENYVEHLHLLGLHTK